MTEPTLYLQIHVKPRTVQTWDYFLKARTDLLLSSSEILSVSRIRRTPFVDNQVDEQERVVVQGYSLTAFTKGVGADE